MNWIIPPNLPLFNLTNQKINMNNSNLTEIVYKRAQSWLDGNYDKATKAEVKELMKHEDELTDAFYKNLEFGTGGLRGVMGAGTNRMNIYTVGMATQGYSNYLKKSFADEEQIKIAIAYDCRNNSQLYARTAAEIFSGNGFHVYLFESLRPTPELSFAIRHFGCKGGIVITASHNPKEYNGFKAYWDDGGQVISPHDHNIIEEVKKISSIKEVKYNGPESNITLIGEEIDRIYLNKIKELSLSPEAIRENSEMKIVYTPIHGTGVDLVPKVLQQFGFSHVINVPEQDVVDGNFPTVASPNPEESAALKMALEKASQTDADMVMATDPDADRVAIAVRDLSNEFIILNGNQAGSLLVYYLLRRWSELKMLKGKEYVCKTIVTSELIADISKKFGVEYFDVLTGFKFIADIIRKNEGKKKFIGGGEESYGYLAGEFVRDKDAVMSCALFAETAAWAKSKGKSLFELLIEIYIEFGFYKEALVNVVRKGKSGAEEIQKMMEGFRNKPPKKLGGSEIIRIHDYLTQKSYVPKSGKEGILVLPKSNVIQFFLEDESKISVRPSGTEPKIKFYLSVKEPLLHKKDFSKVEDKLDGKILSIKKDLGII